MIARVVVATVALGLVRVTVAHACGGSSSGDSSSGSSSSDGGGSSNSDSGYVTSAAPACYDTTDVHGYRQCSSFGAGWAIPEHMPALALELSTWSARVDFGDVDVGGTVHHSFGADYAYRVVGEDLGDQALATGAKLRLLGHRGRVYVGIEGGVAAVMADDRTQQMATSDAMTSLRSSADTMIMGGAVLGVDHPMGRLSLGAELMAGGQGLVVEATSVRGACETTERHVVGRGLVEGRVRADVWLTPWITVGGFAGKDVISGQTSAGLGIGGHIRAFDGGR
ncbi:MAG: hypothetical protein IPL61_39665 [Myxococcales bacterium]|nr:hypothetical protein [Myxococcales bacterium]